VVLEVVAYGWCCFDGNWAYGSSLDSEGSTLVAKVDDCTL
jgi:hypothetical protein